MGTMGPLSQTTRVVEEPNKGTIIYQNKEPNNGHSRLDPRMPPFPKTTPLKQEKSEIPTRMVTSLLHVQFAYNASTPVLNLFFKHSFVMSTESRISPFNKGILRL